MEISAKQIAKTVVDKLEEADNQTVKDELKSLIAFLAKENKMHIWREIIREIEAYWKEKFGASRIQVVSAHAVSSEMIKQIEEMAKGADIEIRINEKLIGGVIMRIDDKRIDGSIAGKLRRMKQSLKK